MSLEMQNPFLEEIYSFSRSPHVWKRRSITFSIFFSFHFLLFALVWSRNIDLFVVRARGEICKKKEPFKIVWKWQRVLRTRCQYNFFAPRLHVIFKTNGIWRLRQSVVIGGIALLEDSLLRGFSVHENRKWQNDTRTHRWPPRRDGRDNAWRSSAEIAPCVEYPLQGIWV